MYNLPQREVHLDFHTSEKIENIGSRFDKKNFQTCLKKGHVNSITVFAKCHHGWSYYESEKYPMHPHLNFDMLSAQLEACAEIGVAAPIYISAGFDENYFVNHPEQAVKWNPDEPVSVIKEDGGFKYADENPHFHLLCFNNDEYLDYLAGQVEEVVQKFMPVGVFLDICSERVCYCDRCRATVRSLGLDENERDSYVKVSKIVYKKYTDRINASARKYKEDVRIFHNSGHIHIGRRELAYMDTHLELESLPTGGWGYDHFPRSVCYSSGFGLEYLGMTGKFHLSWGEFGGFKHPNALRHEVALSLAFGAKCSVGDQAHPYGNLDEATYELIGKAYAEAEAVESYCYDIDRLTDIGVLATEGLGAGRDNLADTGVCRMLLEGHYLFDVLDSECDFGKYKVIILPDRVESDDPALKEKFAKFVKDGGKILASGKSGYFATGFADLGVKIEGENKYNPCYFAPTYNALGLTPTSYVFYSKNYDCTITDENAKVTAYVREPFFNRAPEHFCSHKHTPFTFDDAHPGVIYGKDGAYVAWEIFGEYADIGSYVLKETVLKMLDTLLGDEKTVRTSLGSIGVVTLNEQKAESRYVLHALYTPTTKRGKNVEIIEDTVPVYDTKFSVKCDKDVKRVTLVPQNKDIPFTKENGRVDFVIDKFEVSQIVVLDY